MKDGDETFFTASFAPDLRVKQLPTNILVHVIMLFGLEMEPETITTHEDSSAFSSPPEDPFSPPQPEDPFSSTEDSQPSSIPPEDSSFPPPQPEDSPPLPQTRTNQDGFMGENTTDGNAPKIDEGIF